MKAFLLTLALAYAAQALALPGTNVLLSLKKMGQTGINSINDVKILKPIPTVTMLRGAELEVLFYFTNKHGSRVVVMKEAKDGKSYLRFDIETQFRKDEDQFIGNRRLTNQNSEYDTKMWQVLDSEFEPAQIRGNDMYQMREGNFSRVLADDVRLYHSRSYIFGPDFLKEGDLSIIDQIIDVLAH